MLIPGAPRDDEEPRHVGADHPTEPGDARPPPSPGFPPPGAFPGSATAFPGSATGPPESWAALSGSGERARLPLPGEQVGPYRVERELARGGMGAVYIAQHVDLGRVVALKLMLADHSQSPKALERFQIEAEAVGRLRHPGIVGVHEAGIHGASPFLAMEFVRGESLQDLLEREGPLEPRRAAELTVQLAEALEHAHQAGVLHRDLKPDNVLLEGGRVRITDFGLAKQLRDTTRESLTKTGQAMGTPGYMPPEQASGERHDFGFPSDVWGLGATLYALLTGRPPFEGQTSVQVITKILTKDPDPPSAKRPEVDAALDRICLTCLEKETTDRYPTMTALAADLHRYLAGDSVEAGPTRAQRRGRRRLASLILGLGATAALGVVVFAQREQLGALLRTRQAEHARAQLLGRAQRALTQIDDAPDALPELKAWLGTYRAGLGDGEPLVRGVLEREAALRLRRDAERGLAALTDDPNVQRRHLRAATWLERFDRPEQDHAALADLVGEVRAFHAERWLVTPLARIDLARSERREQRWHTAAASPGSGRVWGACESGALGLFQLPGGEPLAQTSQFSGVTPQALAWREPALWSARGQQVLRQRPTLDGATLRLDGAQPTTHPYALEALAVSADGQRALAVGGIDTEEQDVVTGWFRFVELDGDALRATAGGELPGIVKAAAALPDGRYVTVGGMVDGRGAEALLWAHDQAEPLARLGLGNRGESVTAHPTQGVVAVGTSNRGVLLLDVSAPEAPPALSLRSELRPPPPNPDTRKAMFDTPFVYGVRFEGDDLLLGSLVELDDRSDEHAVSALIVWRWPELHGGQTTRAFLHLSAPTPAYADEGLELTPDGRFVVQPTIYGRLLVWDGPASMPAALRARPMRERDR